VFWSICVEADDGLIYTWSSQDPGRSDWSCEMAGSLVLLHFFEVSFVPTASETTCKLGRSCVLCLERLKISGIAECLRVIKTQRVVFHGWHACAMPAPSAITIFPVHGLGFEAIRRSHNAIICRSAKQNKARQGFSP
jgi:hypothetical protein